MDAHKHSWCRIVDISKLGFLPEIRSYWNRYRCRTETGPFLLLRMIPTSDNVKHKNNNTIQFQLNQN